MIIKRKHSLILKKILAMFLVCQTIISMTPIQLCAELPDTSTANTTDSSTDTSDSSDTSDDTSSLDGVTYIVRMYPYSADLGVAESIAASDNFFCEDGSENAEVKYNVLQDYILSDGSAYRLYKNTSTSACRMYKTTINASDSLNTIAWTANALTEVTDETEKNNMTDFLSDASNREASISVYAYTPSPFEGVGKYVAINDSSNSAMQFKFTKNFLSSKDGATVPYDDFDDDGNMTLSSDNEREFAEKILAASNGEQSSGDSESSTNGSTVAKAEEEDEWESLLIYERFQNSNYADQDFETAFKQNMVLGNYLRPGLDTVTQLLNTGYIKDVFLGDAGDKSGMINVTLQKPFEYMTVPLYKGSVADEDSSTTRATVKDLFTLDDGYSLYINYYDYNYTKTNPPEDDGKTSYECIDNTELREDYYTKKKVGVYQPSIITYLYYDGVQTVFQDTMSNLAKVANAQLAIDMYGNIVISSSDTSVNETVVLPAMANPYFCGGNYLFTNRFILASYNNLQVDSFLSKYSDDADGVKKVTKKDLLSLGDSLATENQTIITSLVDSDGKVIGNYKDLYNLMNGSAYKKSDNIWPTGTKYDNALNFAQLVYGNGYTYDSLNYNDDGTTNTNNGQTGAVYQMMFGSSSSNNTTPSNVRYAKSTGFLGLNKHTFQIYTFVQAAMCKSWENTSINVLACGLGTEYISSLTYKGIHYSWPYLKEVKLSDEDGNSVSIFQMTYGNAATSPYLEDFKGNKVNSTNWMERLSTTDQGFDVSIFLPATIAIVFTEENGAKILQNYCAYGSADGSLTTDMKIALAGRFKGPNTVQAGSTTTSETYLYAFIRGVGITFTVGDGSSAEDLEGDSSEEVKEDATSIIKNMAYMLNHLGESLTKIATMKLSYTYNNIVGSGNQTASISNHLFEIDTLWDDYIIQKVLKFYLTLVIILNCLWLLIRVIPLFGSQEFELSNYFKSWCKAVAISLVPVVIFVAYISINNWCVSKYMRNTMNYWTSIQLENINKQTTDEQAASAALANFLAQTVNADVSQTYATVGIIDSNATKDTDGYYEISTKTLNELVGGGNLARGAIASNQSGVQSSVVKGRLMVNAGTDDTHTNYYTESLFYYFYDVMRAHYYMYYTENSSNAVNLISSDDGTFSDTEKGMTSTTNTVLQMINDPVFLYGQSWLNNGAKIGDFTEASSGDIAKLKVQDICGLTDLFSGDASSDKCDVAYHSTIENAIWYQLLSESPAAQGSYTEGSGLNSTTVEFSYFDPDYYGKENCNAGSTTYKKVIFGAECLYPATDYQPTTVEYALNIVNKEVATDLLKLNDYYNMSDETIMQLAAFTMTMDFNRIMNSTFRPSQKLQPQVYDGDSYTLDTVMRSFFAKSNTQLSNLYSTDIMTLVEDKGGIISQILVILCAVAATLVGLTRYIVLLFILIFSMVVFMVVYNVARDFYSRAVMGLGCIYILQLAFFNILMLVIAMLCVPSEATIVRSVFQNYVGLVKLIALLIIFCCEIVALGWLASFAVRNFWELGGDIVEAKINELKSNFLDLVAKGKAKFTGQDGNVELNADNATINNENATEESTQINEEDALNQNDTGADTDVNRAREAAGAAVATDEVITGNDSEQTGEDNTAEEVQAEEARTEANNVTNNNEVGEQIVEADVNVNESEDTFSESDTALFDSEQVENLNTKVDEINSKSDDIQESSELAYVSADDAKNSVGDLQEDVTATYDSAQDTNKRTDSIQEGVADTMVHTEDTNKKVGSIQEGTIDTLLDTDTIKSNVSDIQSNSSMQSATLNDIQDSSLDTYMNTDEILTEVSGTKSTSTNKKPAQSTTSYIDNDVQQAMSKTVTTFVDSDNSRNVTNTTPEIVVTSQGKDITENVSVNDITVANKPTEADNKSKDTIVNVPDDVKSAMNTPLKFSTDDNKVSAKSNTNSGNEQNNKK